MVTRAFFDAGLVFYAVAALAATLLMARTVVRPYVIARGQGDGAIQFAGTFAGAFAAAVIASGNLRGAIAAAAATLLVMLGLRRRLPQLSMPGAIETAVQPLFLLWTLPWSCLLIVELGFPRWAVALTALGGLVSLVLLGFTLAGKLARDAVLTHTAWERPNRPLPPMPRRREPKVSVQVPCYSEPPEVVKATMDRLAALDYRNFEVLVCDNNTADEALWMPLRDHAAAINRQAGRELVRFFHVASLPGAKAGALNWLASRQAPDAELVAVLDADYLAEPDFLSRLVGFFDDPAIGYVQTPHDYRDYARSPYLRSCYWEYTPTNKVVYPGINEYDAPFTIGTMCVVRADALARAGGWAEWCLTEDSELSIRLRALGFAGIYLRDTFGRGLIPEAFSDYKKQRFRWTAGPVQQLRRYWRLYLPERLGGARSGLNGWSKLLEFQRSAAPLLDLLGNLWGVTVGLAVMLLTVTGRLPVMVMPDAAWFAFTLVGVTALVGLWHRYRLAGCLRLEDMARAELAKASLTYVQMVAGLAGLSSRPRAWTRTPKFGAEAAGARALLATLPEIGIAALHLVALAVMIVAVDLLGPHLVVVAGLGLLLSAARFVAAPVMSVLSERHIAAMAARGTGPAADAALAAGPRAYSAA